MDFTLSVYKELLCVLKANKYSFQSFENFLENPAGNVVVLRHDVDKHPERSFEMALLEHQLAIRGTYYFRVVPDAWNETVIERIAGLGHEVGYHYEDLTLSRGHYENAIRHFEKQLMRFRKIAKVKTICMHGSPFSRHDNRSLWNQYDYRDFGIIGEPYCDIDFNDVFYITDTGRKWNHAAANVRDRVDTDFAIPIMSTFHLMALAKKGALPARMMITVHPQRWLDKPWPWFKEWAGQAIKNGVKRSFKLLPKGTDFHA